MRGEIVFIILGISAVGLSVYLVWLMGLPVIIFPIMVAIIGGALIGVGLMWGRERELEEALRSLQETTRPRGTRLIMPWDNEMLMIMLNRSAPKITTLIERRIEGVRGGRERR